MNPIDEPMLDATTAAASTNATRPPNPFPGLRPFRSDEHHLFFGREEQTAALLQLLRTNRFLAVVGTSGSGKSSLVRAGLIAGLHGGTMTQAGSAWEVMILRPGGSPIENLARAFVDAQLYDPADADALPRLLATLGRSRYGLVEATRQSDVFEPGTNLLVVVDQFEELFRFRQQGVESEEAAAAFVNLLLTASQQEECPVYVAITMRSDYLGDCSEIPGLAEAVNEGEYLIPRLGRDQKRDAIERPVGVGGARIDPLLVQRLLNDVGDDPDQLPVLQHALMRTWATWSAGGDPDRPIDDSDFEATGGLASALSNHADEIYAALPDDRHRLACAKVFKTLTEKGADNRGIRRPTRLAQLVAIADSDPGTVTTVLDAFRGAGVTFLMPGSEVELTDRTVLDLSHESLMRGWERLRGWVEDEAQSARIFRRLLDTARLWRDGRAGLFRDPDLQIALSWREREAPNAAWAGQYGGAFDEAVAFLDTSRYEAGREERDREAAQRRELDRARQLAETQAKAARLFKRFAGVLAAGLCVAVGLTVWAFHLRQEANRQEAAANRQRQEAEQSRQAESAQRQVAEGEKKRADVTLADMYTSRGLLAGSRDAAEAVLWFAGAADQSAIAEDPQRQEANRVRARNWMRQATLPVAAIMLPGFVKQAEFQPNGQLLLLRHGETKVMLWSWRDDKSLPWADALAGVGSVRFSPDGNSIAIGFLSGEVQLRKTVDGQLLAKTQIEGQVGALAFSPDGRFLAVGSHVVRVWDVGAGAFLNPIWNHGQGISGLAFNRKGDRLITACVDKLARVFAVDNNARDPLYPPIPHTAASAPALVDEDRGLITVTGDSELTRYDFATGKPAGPPIRTKPRSLGAGVVATPDGAWFATGGVYGPELFAVDSAVPPVHLTHTNGVTHMAFSPDSSALLSVSWDQTARLWSVPLGQPIGPPIRHMSTATLCAWSPDSQHFVTVQQDGLVRVWQRPTDDPVLVQQPAWGQRARISPDGRLAAPGLFHEAPYGGPLQPVNSVRVLLTETGKPAGPDIPLSGPLNDSRICSDNVAVAATFSRGKAGFLGIWDVATARPRFEPVSLPGEPIAIAARPGRDQLAVICSTGDLLVFDDKTGQRVLGVRHEGWVAPARQVQVLYTPDGGSIVSLGAGIPPTVNVRDAESGKLRFGPIRSTVEGSNIHSMSVSADSRLLATYALVKNNVQVWDLATGRALAAPLPHPGDFWGIFSVRFSPDGTRIITSHRDGQVRYWDWRAGKLACPPMMHDNDVYDAAVTPDGRFAITGVRDRPELRVWELKTGRLIAPPVRLDFSDGRSSDTVAITPDGRRALVGFGVTTMTVVDLGALLSPSTPPVPDLTLLAELATAQHIDVGDLSGMTTDEWLGRWNRLQSRNPDLARSFFTEPRPYALTPRVIAAAFNRASTSGRIRDLIPLLTTASAAHPDDTLLSLKVAVLQAWFAQDDELAATRQRVLAFAKASATALTAQTANRAAKVCTILPSTDKPSLETALVLARKAVELGKGSRWNLLALGMAEYRAGNFAAADQALLATVGADKPISDVARTADFYRAMSLFRQNKPDEARELATAAAKTMNPLPTDEQNPLANKAGHDDLILWLAYKEAKALIMF